MGMGRGGVVGGQVHAGMTGWGWAATWAGVGKGGGVGVGLKSYTGWGVEGVG